MGTLLLLLFRVAEKEKEECPQYQAEKEECPQ